MQEVSNAIAHIFRIKYKNDPNNYLDDFLLVELLRNHANELLWNLMNLCDEIGMPVAPEKTCFASQVVVFLGYLINSRTGTISIPVEKRDKAVQMIEVMLRQKKTRMINIQQLAGVLNFLCNAIVPGRAFTRRLYAKTAGLKQFHHTRVDSEMRQDLLTWQKFLAMSDSVTICRPFADFAEDKLTEIIDCSSDASTKIGFGCAYRNKFAFGIWGDQLKDFEVSINWMELYALCVGVYLFSPQLANRRVTILCDNTSVVDMVNKSSSKSRECMILIRHIVLKAMVHNTRIFVQHIPGEKNIKSDLLSRNKLQEFTNKFGSSMDCEPMELPGEIWPIPKVWFRP